MAGGPGSGVLSLCVGAFKRYGSPCLTTPVVGGGVDVGGGLVVSYGGGDGVWGTVGLYEEGAGLGEEVVGCSVALGDGGVCGVEVAGGGVEGGGQEHVHSCDGYKSESRKGESFKSGKHTSYIV